MTKYTEKASEIRKALGLSEPEKGWEHLRSHTLLTIKKLGLVKIIANKVKLLKESNEFTEAVENETASSSRIAQITEEMAALQIARSKLRKERIAIRKKLFNIPRLGKVLIRYSLLDAYVSLVYKEEKKKISPKRQGREKYFTEKYVGTLRSRITELELLIEKKEAGNNEADN
jgi:hypothetical protein